MRVVVTRPLAKAESTLAALARLGHETVLLPLATARHHPARARAALSAPFSAIAVTSSEVFGALGGRKRLGADLLAMPLFAVGAATASAARAFGFSNIFQSEGDGGNLARLIAERRRAEEIHPVLYLAGKPRASRLERGLEAASVPFRTVEAYEMQVNPLSLETQQRLLVDARVDVVLLYSRQNAEAFFNLPVFATSLAALDKTLFLCLSKNVAEGLPDGFRKRAIVAMRPDEDALIDLL